MALLTLPNELLLLIAETLPEVQDVNSLLKTNTRLFSLLTPHLHALAQQPHKCPVLPLCWAAWKDHPPLVNLLLSSGLQPETPDPENGDTALHYALSQRLHNNPTSSILQTLLSKTKDVNVPSAADGSTLLHRAAAAGAMEELRMLLATPGVDVDARVAHTGETPLTRAVVMGRVDAVRLLLEAGASASQPPLPTSGQTLLSLAASLSFSSGLGITELLLRFGADASVLLPTDGQTVLHRAVEAPGVDLLNVYFANGVSPDLRNWLGRTALDAAVLLGCERAAEVLLRAGADVDDRGVAPGEEGQGGEGAEKTHLFRALMYSPKRVASVKLLLRFGADYKTRGPRGGKSVVELARERELGWALQIFEEWEGKGKGKGKVEEEKEKEEEEVEVLGKGGKAKL